MLISAGQWHFLLNTLLTHALVALSMCLIHKCSSCVNCGVSKHLYSDIVMLGRSKVYIHDIKVLYFICLKTIYWSVLSDWMTIQLECILEGIYWPLSDEKWQWWEFGLVWFSLLFFISGDITQKGYEKKRSKLLQAYLPHTPGNTHTHTHTPYFTKQHTVLLC